MSVSLAGLQRWLTGDNDEWNRCRLRNGNARYTVDKAGAATDNSHAGFSGRTCPSFGHVYRTGFMASTDDGYLFDSKRTEYVVGLIGAKRKYSPHTQFFERPREIGSSSSSNIYSHSVNSQDE